MIGWLRGFIVTLLVLMAGVVEADEFDLYDHLVIKPQLSSQKLTGWWNYCQTDAVVDIQTIEHCQFKPVPQNKLTSGFSAHTHLLRFDLTNPTQNALSRWLEVGHPRLQKVQLFKQVANGEWIELITGQNIPANQRPIVSQRLLLPIELNAQEKAKYVLAVSSETRIDLSLTLWQLDRYFSQESRNQVIQTFAMGGLLLAIVFSLIIFVQWREWATLWLALSFSAEILLDASYTGLMSAYFWPDNSLFNIHLHALFASLTMVFFLGFVRAFLQTSRETPIMDGVLLVLMGLLLITGIGSFWVGYGTPIKLIALLSLTSMLFSSWLFYQAWRRGSGAAGYLLIGYLLLLVMIIYRTVIALGWLPALPLEGFGFSWYFLLIAPTALIAVMKRYDRIRQDLIRIESEREAYATFLTSMSHELRSPVSRILTQAKSNQGPSSFHEHQQKLGEIYQASKHLLAMIDDILDYARTRAGKIHLEQEPFSLTELMASVVAEMMPQVEASQNQLVWKLTATSASDWVKGDERRLRQVLINLLSNANRYCQLGCVRFDIEIVSEDATNYLIQFSVSDTGMGIAEADIALIFKPFERLKQAQSSVDGVGIGLSVCQQLVELMGGQIEVSSQLGKGSRFSFAIRLAKDTLVSLPKVGSDDFMRPEGEVITELQQYVRLGSISDIQDWITRMQQVQPEYPAFYDALHIAVQNLDLAELKRLSS